MLVKLVVPPSGGCRCGYIGVESFKGKELAFA
jgi:hypothetical protein